MSSDGHRNEEVAENIEIMPSSSISIRTSPSDALVELDGHLAGVTPLMVRFLEDGPHTFIFKKEFYKDRVEELDFDSSICGAELEYELELQGNIETHNDGALFKDAETGIITDHETGLEWLIGPDRDLTWDEANEWIRSLGGQWRLPAENEWKRLLELEVRWKEWGPFQNSGWWIWGDNEFAKEDRRYCYPFAQGFSKWYGDPDSSNMTRVFAVRRRPRTTTTREHIYIVPSAEAEKAEFGVRHHPFDEQLVIRSFPSAASVSVNGHDLGQTPLFLKDIGKEPFRVRIEKQSFLPWEELVHVNDPNGPVDLKAVLRLSEYWEWITDSFVRIDLGELYKFMDDEIVFQFDTGYFWKPFLEEENFKKAMGWLEAQGDHWRLPTLAELETICESNVIEELLHSDGIINLLFADGGDQERRRLVVNYSMGSGNHRLDYKRLTDGEYCLIAICDGYPSELIGTGLTGPENHGEGDGHGD